jgi:hypothetical protein
MGNLLYSARFCLSDEKKNVQEEREDEDRDTYNSGWKQTKAPPAHWSVKIRIIAIMTSIWPNNKDKVSFRQCSSLLTKFQFVGSFEDKNEKNNEQEENNDNDKQVRLDAQKLAMIYELYKPSL